MLTLTTSPEEFSKFLTLLPNIPIFIPIISNGKRPEVQAGESWKNPKYHLNPEQALARLKEGKNVGVVANDWLVIVDLDNPAKFKLDIKTLTVETRNGKLHMYFQNAGDVENSVGKNTLAKCGEARAEWQYVLAPGSFVPTDEGVCNSGNGLYHIIDPSPLAVLKRCDLPEDFVPTAETADIPSEVLSKPLTTRNKYGWDLEDIRARDKKLDQLLSNDNTGYPSGSEADMATISKLLFWEFDQGEAVSILKKYRYRPKLDRSDYITHTLGRVTQSSKVSDKVNPQKWNPKTNTDNPIKQNSKRIDLGEIITNFKTQYIFKTPKDTEELHYYNNGIYRSAEHMIKSIIENVHGAKATIHDVNEVIEHLRWSSYVDRADFNRFQGSIPVQNGLLNLSTGELKDFTPEEIFTFKLPVKYDKEAKCPKFKAWLNEVQTPDNILTLQEYAGYSLLPSMPFHKSIWFIGQGRNGKGTYVITLEEIIGKENCAYIPIQLFNGERNFAEAELYGKLVNVSSEPTTKKELETPLFKKLTGDDFVNAEIKCKQKHLGFRNVAKFYILGNKYPRVRDNTDAFKERIIVIKWEKQFLEGKNQIQKIEQNWTRDETEKSGILNWMMEGLQRLIQNSKFSLTATQREMMIEFERASDSIAAWMDERLVYDPNSYIKREDAAQDYMTYCDYYSIFICEKNKLFDRLRNKPKIRDAQQRILGKIERVWKGVKLSDKKLEPPEEPDIEKQEQKTLSEAVEAPETPKTNSDISINNIINENNLQNPVSTASNASVCVKVHSPEAYKAASVLGEIASEAISLAKATEETYRNRFCSDECQNFRNRECGPGTNVLFRPMTAEIPKDCKNYLQKGALADGE